MAICARILAATIFLLAVTACGRSSSTVDTGDAVSDTELEVVVPPGCPPGADNPLVGSCFQQMLENCRDENYVGWKPNLGMVCVDTGSALAFQPRLPADADLNDASAAADVAPDGAADTDVIDVDDGAASIALGNPTHVVKREIGAPPGLYNPGQSNPCVQMNFSVVSSTEFALTYTYSRQEADAGVVSESIRTIRYQPWGTGSRDGFVTPPDVSVSDPRVASTTITCPDGSSLIVSDEQSKAFSQCVGLSCHPTNDINTLLEAN